jgi:hypothetical protein
LRESPKVVPDEKKKRTLEALARLSPLLAENYLMKIDPFELT